MSYDNEATKQVYHILGFRIKQQTLCFIVFYFCFYIYTQK